MNTIAILFAILLADPVEIQGRVVSITDGDTIKVLVEKEQIVVRLEGIDAPESKQPFGTKSKEALAALCHEKNVVVRSTGKDRYGRTLGTVKVDKTDVNAEMVKTGFAWHYKQYSKDAELGKLEDSARESKLGLWADKDPVPPWEWRKTERARNAKK